MDMGVFVCVYIKYEHPSELDMTGKARQDHFVASFVHPSAQPFSLSLCFHRPHLASDGVAHAFTAFARRVYQPNDESSTFSVFLLFLTSDRLLVGNSSSADCSSSRWYCCSSPFSLFSTRHLIWRDSKRRRQRAEKPPPPPTTTTTTTTTTSR